MSSLTRLHPDCVGTSSPECGNEEASAQPLTIPEKLCNLPPFHAVANEILNLSIDPDVDLNRIAFLIESDVAFAAEVLLLANSALYGLPSKVHSVRHAVTILGLDRMATLAVTIAMRALLGKRTPVIRTCWNHTVACAIVCQQISKQFGVSPDRGYTAGLMHDVGRLGLITSYPGEIATIFNSSYLNAAEVLKMERTLVKLDHCTAGAWLLKVWAFPDAFYEICSHHHDTLQRNDSDLLQLVKIGCQVADTVGFSAVQYEAPINPDDILARIGKQTGRNGFPTLSEIREHVTAKLSVFAD